jgi:hypothetical protein
MLKKFLTNVYVMVGMIAFIFLLFVGVYGMGYSWGESILASAALAAVIVVVTWLKEFIF